MKNRWWLAGTLTLALFAVLFVSGGQQSEAPSFAETVANLEAQGAIVHMIVPAAVCTGPDDADSNAAFLLLAGEEDLPTGAVEYEINATSIPRNVNDTEAIAAINTAFDQWQFPSGGHTFNNAGDNSALLPADDDTNVVSFVRFAGPKILLPLAFASVDPGGDNDGEFDIVLVANWNWSANSNFIGDADTVDGGCGGRPGKIDVQAVVTHEAGHGTRLDHPGNDVQTMFFTIAERELFKRTLADGDKCGMEAQYTGLDAGVNC